MALNDIAQLALCGILELALTALARRERLNRFLDELRLQGGLLAEFGEALFRATADRSTVRSEREVAVLFRDGTEIVIDVVGR